MKTEKLVLLENNTESNEFYFYKYEAKLHKTPNFYDIQNATLITSSILNIGDEIALELDDDDWDVYIATEQGKTDFYFTSASEE